MRGKLQLFPSAQNSSCPLKVVLHIDTHTNLILSQLPYDLVTDTCHVCAFNKGKITIENISKASVQFELTWTHDTNGIYIKLQECQYRLKPVMAL